MCVCETGPHAPQFILYVLVNPIRLRPTTDADGGPETPARSFGGTPPLAHGPSATGEAGDAGSMLGWPVLWLVNIAGDFNIGGGGNGSSPVGMADRPLACVCSTEPAPVRAATSAYWGPFYCEPAALGVPATQART